MKTRQLFSKNHSYRLLLLILSVLLFTNVRASSIKAMDTEDNDDAARYLLVWNNDGSCTSFALTEHPCITVDVIQGLVNCVTRTEDINLPLNDIHKYTLDANDGSSAGISPATDEEGIFKNHAGNLFFYNYEPGTIIAIYNINGTAISTEKINSDGTLLISTAKLKRGIYLIKAGKITYKITIK